MTSGSPANDGLPAELREAPVVEPTIEVDEGVSLPPEAAVVALTHHEGGPAGAPGADASGGGTDPAAYRAVAAAERAAEEASLPPAEMRTAPIVEPTVEVDDGVRLPPEAAVIPKTRPGAS